MLTYRHALAIVQDSELGELIESGDANDCNGYEALDAAIAKDYEELDYCDALYVESRLRKAIAEQVALVNRPRLYS